MMTRRMLLGSTAAAAGVGVLGFTSVNVSTPVAAQRPRRRDPVTTELHRQLKGGLGKLRGLDPDGARQIATTLRIYGATLDDAGFRTELRKVGKSATIRARCCCRTRRMP